MIFHENCLLADNSHEISYLILLISKKNFAKLSFAAVVIGALRVNNLLYFTKKYEYAMSVHHVLCTINLLLADVLIQIVY